MERETAKRLTLEALQHALNGRYGEAWENFNALAATRDARTLYLACCGWAGSAEVALEAHHGRRAAGTWTPSDVHPDGLGNSPERAFAVRFITAYCNSDKATTEALFAVAANAAGHQFAKSLAVLLMTAAELNLLAQLTT